MILSVIVFALIVCLIIFVFMSKSKHQLRLIVTRSSVIGKSNNVVFEKYLNIPLDSVPFSKIIDVFNTIYEFPINIEFKYDSLEF